MLTGLGSHVNNVTAFKKVHLNNEVFSNLQKRVFSKSPLWKELITFVTK